MFKLADKQFEKLGYKKVEETETVCSYEKERFWGTQRIEILYKDKSSNLGHIVISFDNKINDDGFNNCCGMNAREMKVCLRKMREMKLIDIFGNDIHYKKM